VLDGVFATDGAGCAFTLNGRDITDEPVDFREKDVEDVEVVLTPKVFRRDTNAANSSRSPTDHSEGPRMTACVCAECGRPKKFGRYHSVRTTSGARKPETARMTP
jgi:hypothetical protein